MSLEFNGDVVVVTGAGTGIGRSHALTLAGLGARVVVNDVTNGANAVSDEICALGGIAVPSVRDISTSEGADALIVDAIAAFGDVHAVINNAGVLSDGDIPNITDDAWRRVVGVNLDSPFYVTRAAWPHFLKQGYGRLVFTTSASGIFGNVGHAHYSAAKAGVVGLMRAAALEGRSFGIRANAIAPLAVSLQSLQQTPSTSSRRSARELVGAAFDTFSPEQVSSLVVLLAHRDCPDSGAVVATAGGYTRRISLATSRGWNFTSEHSESILAGWTNIGAGPAESPSSLEEDMLLLRGYLAEES